MDLSEKLKGLMGHLAQGQWTPEYKETIIHIVIPLLSAVMTADNKGQSGVKVTIGDQVRIIKVEIAQGEKRMKVNVLANGMTWTAADGTDSRIKRLVLEARNGAKGSIIWEYSNEKPRFLGTNMTEAQLNSGRRAVRIAEAARLNKAATEEDIHAILTEGGWESFYPMA